jgi:hypothetical protein
MTILLIILMPSQKRDNEELVLSYIRKYQGRTKQRMVKYFERQRGNMHMSRGTVYGSVNLQSAIGAR